MSKFRKTFGKAEPLVKDPDAETIDRAQVIDALCDEFEVEFDDPHRRPSIEHFLDRVPTSLYDHLLKELILLEVLFRLELGEAPSVAEYAERFAEKTEIVDAAFATLSKGTTTRASDTRVDGSEQPEVDDSSSRRNLPCMFGDYELLEEVGKGGMGVVYKARQLDVDRIVAIKLIRQSSLFEIDQKEQEQTLTRFQREARAQAQVEHDHVVALYDVGEFEGQVYCAMRYVDGSSLRDQLHEGPLEPKSAARYMAQVADAVEAAHTRGIFHRDIKPHNIMIDQRTGRALLTDFGLAKLATGDQELTSTRAVLGSPPYMSPEQMTGSSAVSTTTDVYGLGATLYHALIGRPPFQAATVTATMALVQFEDPVRPRALDPTLPRDLETICLKCLEKRSSDRYASAGEVRDELQRFLQGLPVHARAIGSLERMRRWAYRYPARVSLIAVSAVALALMIGLFWVAESSREYQQAEAQALAIADAQMQAAAIQRKLAETNKYHALVSSAQEKLVRRSLGWTWNALAEIRNAMDLHVDLQDRARVRSLMAQCLSTLDVNPEFSKVAPQIEPGTLTFSPDGKYFAIGQLKHPVAAQVLLVDGATNAVAHELSVPTAYQNASNVLEDLSSAGKHDGVDSLAFSHDGKFFAAGMRYGRVAVWDCETFDPPRIQMLADAGIALKGREVKELFFYANGNKLLVRLADHSAKIWDLSSNEVLKIPDQFLPVVSVAVDPIEDSAAFLIEDRIQLVDLDTWDALIDPVRLPGAQRVFLDPTSRSLAISCVELDRLPRRVEIRSMDSGEYRRSLVDGDHESEQELALRMHFSQDGASAVTTGKDKMTRIWELSTGHLKASFTQTGRDALIQAISPTLDKIAIDGHHTTCVHEVRHSIQRFLGVQAGKVSDFRTIDESVILASERFVNRTDKGSLTRVDISRYTIGSGKLSSRSTYFCPFKVGPHEYSGRLAVDPSRNRVALSIPFPGPLEWRTEASGTVRAPQPWQLLAGPFLEQLKFHDFAASIDCRTINDPLAADGIAVLADSTAAEIRLGMDKVQLPDNSQNWAAFAVIRVEGPDGDGGTIEAGTYGKEGPLTASPYFISPEGYHLLMLGWTTATRTDVQGFFLKPHTTGSSVVCDQVFFAPLFEGNGWEWIRKHKQIAYDGSGTGLWGIAKNNRLVHWSAKDRSYQERFDYSIVGTLQGIDSLSALAAGSGFALIGCGNGRVYRLVGKGTAGGVNFESRIRSLSLSPAETQFAAGLANGHLIVGDANTLQKLMTLVKHSRAITAVDFASMGDIAAGTEDGRVWLFTGTTRVLDLQFHTAVEQIDFDPTTKVLLLLLKGENAVRVLELAEVLS